MDHIKITGSTGESVGSSNLNPAQQVEYLARHLVRVSEGLTHPRSRFLGSVIETALEYADEAERREGFEYWFDFFKDVDEAVKDFVVYLQNRD